MLPSIFIVPVTVIISCISVNILSAGKNVYHLSVAVEQSEDPLVEKRVSFIEQRTFSAGSEHNYQPVINIIASTPVGDIVCSTCTLDT